jgi:hypothetical protein
MELHPVRAGVPAVRGSVDQVEDQGEAELPLRARGESGAPVKPTNRVFIVETIVQINYDSSGPYFPTQQDAEGIMYHIIQGDIKEYADVVSANGRSYNVRIKSNR